MKYREFGNIDVERKEIDRPPFSVPTTTYQQTKRTITMKEKNEKKKHSEPAIYSFFPILLFFLPLPFFLPSSLLAFIWSRADTISASNSTSSVWPSTARTARLQLR